MIKQFLASLILTYSLIQSHQLPITIVSDADLCHFSLVDSHVSHTGTDACIVKITDGKKLYIVKQIHHPSLDEQFLLINDLIASTIGCKAGIPVNEVFFIPYNSGCHLKIYPERAATLHTYVAGQDLEQLLPGFLPAHFTLQQRVINPKSSWQKKCPLNEHEQGVTKTIIESMCCNDAFVLLVALDTVVGNSDRSLPNILFDKEKGFFCGIDQAAAFARRLPLLAIDRLNELINEGYFDACAPIMIEGLRLYRDTLIKLKQSITPDMIIQAMKQLIPYLASDALENSELQERIDYHTMIVESNYLYVDQLIDLLDNIIQNYLD